jgi:nicotinamide-nucleotide amidase
MTTAPSDEITADEEVTALAESVGELAAAQGRQVGLAESLTSGAIASALGKASGASDWFAGGVVAYSEHVKFEVLGVAEGPVITASCATQMARGAADLLSADAVIAVTGAGGPDPEEGHEAGTVFLAHGCDGDIQVREMHLDGDPAKVVQETVRAALRSLRDDLRAAQPLSA